MIQKGDICKLKGSEMEPVDVITGGSPCQDISICGKGEGLNGIESRLFFEQMRVIREMREAGGSPRYMVWENVPNIISCNSGNDFRRVLSDTIGIVDPNAGKAFSLKDVPKDGWKKAGALFGEGWSIAWRVTNAKLYGVPQSRRRIALVADFDGLSAADILFGSKPLEGPPARPVMFEKFKDGVWEYYDDEALNHSDYGEGPERPCETDIWDYLDSHTSPEFYLSVKACEGILKRAARRHKVISPNLKKGLSGNIALNPKEHGLPEGEPIVIETLRQDGFADYKISHYCAALKASGGDYGHGSECIVVEEIRKEGREPLYMARRLSVTECERIQGFPDGWTDIGELNEETGEKFFVDEQGVRRKVTLAQRGKALGNSIALPFWQHLAEQICSQYKRTVTIGSLFDGISGFCYVFEKCGAKVIWCSEIEPLPSEVARVRLADYNNGKATDR